MNQEYQTLCLQSIILYLHYFFFHWCVCPVQWIALLHDWYVYRLIFATYVSYLIGFHEISVMNVCDTTMVWNRNGDRRRGRRKIFKAWNQLVWDEKGKKGRKGLQEKKNVKDKILGLRFLFFRQKRLYSIWCDLEQELLPRRRGAVNKISTVMTLQSCWKERKGKVVADKITKSRQKTLKTHWSLNPRPGHLIYNPSITIF